MMPPIDRSELTVTFAHNFVHAAALTLATTLVLTACRGEDPAGSATETSTSSTGTDTTTSGTPTTTDTPTTTGSVEPTTSTGEPTTGFDPCAGGAGFIDCTTGETTTGSPNQQPNGGQCASDADCISGNCYEIPIPMVGGVCGECDEDQDCVDAGTGIGCSLSMAGGVCTQGDVGNGCMSDDACMEGLTCGPAIDLPIPGLLPDSCNECEDSSDCEMGMVCNPTVDILSFSGSRQCVAEGSVANDNLCDIDGDGDLACTSGICAPVNIMGFIEIGVCGECETDDDCPMGTTCTPGSVSQGGLAGSVCQ